MYVIRRNEDGKYVTPSGSGHSYTRWLEEARTFTTYDAAKRECCSNERPVPVESLLSSRRSR
jgi:hypothetical protein